ncbi:MAG TPA: hypothetical protein VK698_17635 [Kofleriaceae bacterium]|nr:hypothetical protein [Kofleriaceae bacterium]
MVQRWSAAGLAVVAMLGGCGGDDDGGDDGGSTADAAGGSLPDGGGNGGGDGGGGTRSDAGDPDSGARDASLPGRRDAGDADGGSPDAATGPGLVSVTFRVAPYAPDSADVFFLRADDSVIDVVRTDSNGRAEATLDEPGTVVLHFKAGVPPSQDAFIAYLKVPPRTDITFMAEPLETTGSLTVTGPAPASPTGFGVETRCGTVSVPGTTPTATVGLGFCPPVIDVIWTATGLVEGVPRGFSAFRAAVPVATGPITVVGSLRPDRIQTSRLVGLPDAAAADARALVFGDRGAVQHGLDHDSLVPTDGSLDFVDPLHDLRGLGLRDWVYAQLYTDDNVMDLVAVVDHIGNPTYDVSAVVTPILAGSVFHRDTASWTWTEVGPGSVTAVHGTVYALAADEPFYWRVLAPHDGTPPRVPRLPAPFDRFDVGPTTPVSSQRFELYGHTDGYGAILSQIEGFIYGLGEAGDVGALTYGFNDSVE